MFPLHDRTRRLLCRCVFLLVGLLPTGAVLAWSAVVNGSGHHAAICEQLSSTLGFDVRVANVSHPRSEITRLENFELVDPETIKVLLHSRQLEIHDDEPRQTVIAWQPECNISDRQWQSIIECRLRLSGRKQPPLRLHAAELTLAWTDGKQALHDFTAQFESFDAGNAALVTFNLTDTAAAEPVRLHLQRTNTAGQPSTSFKLQTDATSVPCSLLAALAGCSNVFGSASRFRGTVEVSNSPHGWHGDLAGTIDRVDLQALVSNHFSHHLEGAAEIDVKRAVFRHGRIDEIEGTICVGRGVIGHSLLQALQDSLQIHGSLFHRSAADSVEYDEIAADFWLSEAGLTIRGQCSGATPGTVVRASQTTLLRAPNGTVPVASLIRALVPYGNIQVPATRQADSLLRLLPVPDISPRN